MKKILQSEWGQGAYQGILYGVEILLIFGVSVKLTAFTMGITSGWVSLFTYMLMAGAIFFPFLLNLIHKDQKINEQIQKHTILIRIVLYALIACFTDIRIALLTAVVHLILYFLGNKEWLRPAVSCIVLCVSCYGYTKGWISSAECILLVLSENGIFLNERNMTSVSNKGYAYGSLWRADRKLVKDLILLIALKCIRYVCVIVSLVLLKDAIVMIGDLKELFQYRDTFLYWMILCIADMLCVYFTPKVQKKMMEEDTDEDPLVRLFHASCMPERIAFVIVSAGCSLVFMHASAILCLCMILMCVSFMLVQFLMENGKHTTWILLRNVRTCMIRLFLILWFVLAQTVYDGVFVDYSVVIMSVFVFYGIVQCSDTWKENDVLLDHLLSEEV